MMMCSQPGDCRCADMSAAIFVDIKKAINPPLVLLMVKISSV